MHCGKTAHRTRTPFGIVGRTGPGMRQGLGIGPREGVLLGAHLGRAIVSIGDFTAYVCDSNAQCTGPTGLYRRRSVACGAAINSQAYRQCHQSIERIYDFPFVFNRNCTSISYRL